MFLSGILFVIGFICFCALRYVKNEKLRAAAAVITVHVGNISEVVEEHKKEA